MQWPWADKCLLLPPATASRSPAGVVLWPRYTGPGGRVGTRLKQERQRFNSQLFSLASLPWKTHLPTLRAPWDQLFADPQHFFPPAPA